MPKAPASQIVSANDLLLGDVVYFTETGGWSRAVSDAAVAETPEAAERLLSDARAQPDRAVGPYLVGVARREGGALGFDHHRETIRDHGPTFRPDLDRQRPEA